MPLLPKDMQDWADFYRKNFVTDGESSWVDAPESAQRMYRQAPAMYELLKEMTACKNGPIKYCPICGRGLYTYHAPDCKLAAVLKAVEGE